MFTRIWSVCRHSGAFIAVLTAGLVAGTGGSVQAQPATLRVIIVADENDPTSGGNMKENRVSLVGFLERSVESARLDIRRVDPRLLGRNEILRRVNAVPVNQDDALFVYLAGHGQRVKDDISFTFSTRFATLNRSVLLATMRARRPRLIVLITDTCNRSFERPVFALPSPYWPARLIFNTPLVQSLFFDSRGVLNLVAAAPGEVALCFPVDILPDHSVVFHGSIFTSSLVMRSRCTIENGCHGIGSSRRSRRRQSNASIARSREDSVVAGSCRPVRHRPGICPHPIDRTRTSTLPGIISSAPWL